MSIHKDDGDPSAAHMGPAQTVEVGSRVHINVAGAAGTSSDIVDPDLPGSTTKQVRAFYPVDNIESLKMQLRKRML